MASPYPTSFQTQPGWLIEFVPVTREAQLLKWPTAITQPEKNICSLKTHSKLHWPRQPLRFHHRHRDAVGSFIFLFLYFHLPGRSSMCCWSCASPTMAERCSPGQKDVSCPCFTYPDKTLTMLVAACDGGCTALSLTQTHCTAEGEEKWSSHSRNVWLQTLCPLLCV